MHTLMTIPMLALILLGAHVLRQGDPGLASAFPVLAALVPFRQAWTRWVIPAVLAWGAFVWADSGIHLIRLRLELNQPWMRLGLIMAGVLLFDVLALAVLLGRRAEFHFLRNREAAPAQTGMFVLTVLGLGMARAKVSFPILLADRFFPGWGWLEILLLALYATWIGGKMLTPAKHRKLRPVIWGGFSLIFFLQFAAGLAGAEELLMTGKLHMPVPALITAGPVFRGGGLFMIILFSVTVLLVGPAWCSHLCYIGAWDNVMSRATRRKPLAESVARWTIPGRISTLILTLGTAWLLRIAGVSGLVAAGLAAGFGLIGVGIMVMISRRVGVMVHCTAYCPMGLIANVAGKLSPWRIRVHSDCTGCGACFPSCQYNALSLDQMAKGWPGLSCTLCGDCISACPHGHLEYRFPGLSSRTARTVFLVIVVSLHAVFLGVARI